MQLPHGLRNISCCLCFSLSRILVSFLPLAGSVFHILLLKRLLRFPSSLSLLSPHCLSPWKEPSRYPGPQFFLSKPSLGREGGPGQSVSGWSEAGLGHHCRRQGRAEWPALALSRDLGGRALCHLLALYVQRFLLCKVRNPQGC